MEEKSFNIEGMSCEHCVRAVEKELAQLNIDHYEVEIGLAKVKYDVQRYEDEDIIRAIHEAGFHVKSEKGVRSKIVNRRIDNDPGYENSFNLVIL